MDWKPIQQRLRLTADGIAGPATMAALFQDAGASALLAADMGRQAAHDFPVHGINTPLRLAHFLAQAAHETSGFTFLKELGGPKYFARYDGRADLGNTQPGDGTRFPGRGIFQLTGRKNYKNMGPRVGVDLIAAPERAADPKIAVLIACLYWTDHSLNRWADADDVLAVSRGINCGSPASRVTPNHLDDRSARLAHIRKVLGC